MSVKRASSALALSLFAIQTTATTYPTCESYGVDFQQGGTYFQNISSTDDFTFSSMFEQCQDDSASNILVDPNGDEYLCSNVPLQPDDTNELSTCPIQKDQMWTGPWSVIIMSNNGEAQPIAYEREFSLIVGSPTTVTYTPTITASTTSTPLTSTTISSTTTSIVTTTSNVTVPAVTKSPTTTVHPAPVTTTKIWTLGTITETPITVSPSLFTSTHTMQCSYSTQQNRDPWLTWLPSLVPASIAPSVSLAQATQATASDTAKATTTPTAPAARRDIPILRRVPADRAARIAVRKARLATLEARDIDSATVTVTDTNTKDYVTSTSTITASSSTVSVTTVFTATSTTTSTTTIHSGSTTLPVVTVTAATPTRTAYGWTLITSWASTVTVRPTYTITVTTAPSASTAVCTEKGGRMVPW